MIGKKIINFKFKIIETSPEAQTTTLNGYEGQSSLCLPKGDIVCCSAMGGAIRKPFAKYDTL